MLTKTKKFVLAVIVLSIAGFGLFIYLRSLQDNTAAPNGGGGGASTTSATNPTHTTDQTNTQSGGSSASNANTGANTDTGQGAGGNAGAAIAVIVVVGVLAAVALIVLVKLKKSRRGGVAPVPKTQFTETETKLMQEYNLTPTALETYKMLYNDPVKRAKYEQKYPGQVSGPYLEELQVSLREDKKVLARQTSTWNPDAKPEKSSLVKESRFIKGEAAKAGKAVGSAAKTIEKKVKFVAGDVGKTVSVEKWLNADLVQSNAQRLENEDNPGYVHPDDDGKSFFE